MVRDRTGWQVWVALGIVYVVWGSTYLAIKVAVRTLPPLLTAGTRFLAAATLLAALLAIGGRSLRVTRREALSAAALGVALLAGGVGLVHVAETRIDSAVAAMIAGSVPLQVIAWRLLAGERVARATAVAAGVGLAGLALVVLPEGVGGGSAAVGLAVMLLGTLCWSRGSFVSSRLRLPENAFVSTAYQMLAGGVVLLVVGTLAGEWADLDHEALEAGPVLAWAYLAVAGSVIGFSAYAWLLGHAPISQVVTHQYVNPLVALALGAAFLGERPAPSSLVGAAIVVGAVVVTVRREGAAAPTTEPEGGVPPGTRAGRSG
jgi:drug/metabolite transporter (DMT)-like permease